MLSVLSSGSILLPLSHFGFPLQRDLRISSDLPTPLPPEVTKGIRILPEKSYSCINVSIIRGAWYHQIGKPIKNNSV